jgi:hypothetical protein
VCQIMLASARESRLVYCQEVFFVSHLLTLLALLLLVTATRSLPDDVSSGESVKIRRDVESADRTETLRCVSCLYYVLSICYLYRCPSTNNRRVIGDYCSRFADKRETRSE